MPNSNLTPEQEELLCRLVEAVIRIKPDRAPFVYTKNWSVAEDLAMLTHPGWLEDSQKVFMGDLDALAHESYVRLEVHGRTYKFELPKKAFDFYESRLHPDDGDYKTHIAISIRLDARDRVEVCGERSQKSLPPRSGHLFLRLILGLKQGKGGWVHNQDLVEEGFVTEVGVTQAVSSLRDKLSGLLGSLDPKDFVEASGDGRHRISTPPRLIHCELPSLSRSEDSLVVDLAEKIQTFG